MTHDIDPTSSSVDKGNKLDESEIQRIVEYYETEMKNRVQGPQLEGFEGARIAEALRNDFENVLLVDVKDEMGEPTGERWPLLVPVKYHQDYSSVFFEKHYGEEQVHFFSLPPYEALEELMTSPDGIDEVGEFLQSRHAIIAYDYREGDAAEEFIPEFLKEALSGQEAKLEDVTPESRSEIWKMNYGLPEVVFYEGRAQLLESPEEKSESIQAAINEMIAEGEIEILPTDGPTFIFPEQLQAEEGELLERMWDMYSAQFNVLVEDHPALFEQPKEEFFSTLLDVDTVNIAYMHEGKPVGLLYLVGNIGKCVWLNEKYYDEKYANDPAWVAFYPGVVVAADMAQKDMGFIQEMMNVVSRVSEKAGKDLLMAFACSNISKTYIPKIAETFIEANFSDEERRTKYPQRLKLQRGQGGEGFTESATYKYRVARVNLLED